MILQALNQYYERKVALGDGGIPPLGFSSVKIPVVLELDANGELFQIKTTDNKETKPQFMPQAVKKSINIVSNLLWENAEYALGIFKDSKTKERHAAFVEKIKSLPEPVASDDGIVALIKFLADFDQSAIESDPNWEVLQKKPNVSFQLQGDSHLICQRPLVMETIRNTANSNSKSKKLCMVSGNYEPIARLHPPIKGVWDAKTTGANIVAVNNKVSETGDNQGARPAFSSYGKQQGYNSPVGECASFAYTTALNHLLRKGSSQRMQVGDASTVFWAENNATFEKVFCGIFSSSLKEIQDDPDAYTTAVKAVYQSVHKGRPQGNEEADRFYVLGLSPNGPRISIRFWQVATVAEISQRIKQHFEYLSMTHSERDMPYLPLFLLLVNLASQQKSGNIPPNLAGELMRSILAGRPYPFTLLSAAVRRCKAERKINYPRAAIIKACINRFQSKEELKVSLDLENINTAYRLGRLFAVLEKTQEEANPGINATIKDRYYGAASSNPVSVFPTLLKLKNHHLNKLSSVGPKIYFEKLVGEIMDEILPDLPASMNLQDQGRFAVGYYHQRQDLFTSHKTTETGDQP